MTPFVRFIALLLAVVAPLGAAQLPFSGYSYSVAPDPGYPDSGGELIDGTANGPAWPTFPLVLSDVAYLSGWFGVNSTITFNFAAPVTINSVSAFFADSNGAAGVGLPSTVTLGDGAGFSQLFNVTDPSFSGSTVESVFDGFAITTNTLTLTFSPVYQWTMLSEVRAFNTTAIPEPATTTLALGAAALGLVAYGRRKRA